MMVPKIDTSDMRAYIEGAASGTLPIVSTIPHPFEYAYTAREGDVIERKGKRMAILTDETDETGHIPVSIFRRKWLSGEWVFDHDENWSPVVLSIHVGAMGWTLVARKAQEAAK